MIKPSYFNVEFEHLNKKCCMLCLRSLCYQSTSDPSTFLCTYLKLSQSQRRQKWFLNKAHSVWETPMVLPCLLKDLVVVRKTDSCSLSTWFYVLTLVIYLVVTMTIVGRPWRAGRLGCSDGIILQDDTSSVSQRAMREREPRRETRHTNNAAWCFEGLFIRRLSSEGDARRRLACFLNTEDGRVVKNCF